MAQFSVKNSLKTETKGLALKEQWCDKMSFTSSPNQTVYLLLFCIEIKFYQ